MRQPLTVVVCQPPCVSYDVARNARTHAAVVRSAGARVVAFPELSLTGYELDAPVVSTDGQRLTPVIEACAESGTLALAGAPVSGAAGGEHIAMLAIDGGGVTIAYRKMWLGGDEPGRFTPGHEPAVLDVDGWRLGLAICKDTGVAQHAEDTAALGMDVYVAGTASTPDEDDLQAGRARRVAATHDVPVAIASFAGPTGGGFDRTLGRSGIWAPGGTVVDQAGAAAGATARATLRHER